MDAYNSIEEDVFENFEVTEIEKTVKEVFSGFDISKIKNEDMHPYHIFSINGNLNYELSKIC